MGLSSTDSLEQLLGQFRAAQQATSKSMARMMMEAMRLRYGATGIGFSEYFGYGLYDTARLSPETIASFVSDGAAQQIWEAMNPPMYWGLVSDKVAFQLIMERLGFVQPRLLALYSSEGRVLPTVESLQTADDIERFLRESDNYPLFAKPNNSYRSHGAVGIDGYDAQRSVLKLINGEELPIADFAKEAAVRRSYLFQEKMVPHASLADISGASLSTMRVVVLYGKQGPELFRVVWKIPNKRNMADNFWRPGNVVAHVDQHTGKVYTVIQSATAGFEELGTDNPLGQRFLNTEPPLYREAIDLVMAASRVFPMFGYQAWDIALTNNGPLALEMNHNGDIELLQVGAREGILDARFQELLDSKGVTLKNAKKRIGGN